VQFAGNIDVGKDISLEDLRSRYHAVILAYGAEEDRRLGVPGENLRGVFGAREFVAWYNGLPNFRELNPCLDETDTVAIVGQGNVAVDCARILCKTVEELRATDITEHALRSLSESRVKRVYMIGRRGPVQAAWTTAELRELAQLGTNATCRIVIDPSDLKLTSEQEKELKEDRPKRRMFELLHKTALSTWGQQSGPNQRELIIRFLRGPNEFIADPKDKTRLGFLRLDINSLERSPDGSYRAVRTGQTEDVECQLSLRSIGYKSVPIDGLPFDVKQGTVVHDAGRVQPGLYVAGWLKRGPTGIIGTNKGDAEETVETLLRDMQKGELPHLKSTTPGVEGLKPLLEERGVQMVSYEDWKRIDAAEREMGTKSGKPREKFVRVEDMLRAAGKL